jgi:hypothetical protein
MEKAETDELRTLVALYLKAGLKLPLAAIFGTLRGVRGAAAFMGL